MIGLSTVLAATGGRLYGADPRHGPLPAAPGFQAVGIDSRAIGPGDLFVAVRGAVHDGHRFVPDAVARGAAGALVATGRAAEFATLGVPLIEVDDTLAALGALAAYWRRQVERKHTGALHVVGITGSVGKSSTKELAAAAIGAHRRVLKSPKSYNNEFGLPLSVLLLTPETEVALLEMGTFGPGELTDLAAIAQPNVAVVTNVGHSHLERMGSQAAIAAAKGELVAALPPDGVAVLNGDDPLVRPMATLTRARALTYGLEQGCDLRAGDLRSAGLDGLTFTLCYEGATRSLAGVPLLGRHSVYTALAVAAIGLAVGLSLDDVVASLCERHAPVRLVIVPGIAGATVIDDSYNSSPVSSLAALDILAELPARRRLAVLGDMLELGAFEEEGHRQVGRRVGAVADTLVTIGPRARLIADAARQAGLAPGNVHALAGKDEALALLQRELRAGDLVLIKGSRGLALESLVNALREPA